MYVFNPKKYDNKLYMSKGRFRKQKIKRDNSTLKFSDFMHDIIESENTLELNNSF